MVGSYGGKDVKSVGRKWLYICFVNVYFEDLCILKGEIIIIIIIKIIWIENFF